MELPAQLDYIQQEDLSRIAKVSISISIDIVYLLFIKSNIIVKCYLQLVELAIRMIVVEAAAVHDVQSDDMVLRKLASHMEMRIEQLRDDDALDFEYDREEHQARALDDDSNEVHQFHGKFLHEYHRNY